MIKIEVAFIESAEALQPSLGVFYTKFFEYAGFEVEIFWAASQSDARKIILQKNIYVVISDLTFGADSYNLGLNIIAELKKEFPDLIFIATSKADVYLNDIENKLPTFDMFLDKNKILSAENKSDLIHYVERFIDLFKFNSNSFISNINLVGNDFQKKDEIRQFKSLLAQATFTSLVDNDTTWLDKMTLQPLTKGFSGSHVYRLEAQNSTNGLLAVPAVLKVSKRDKAEKELINFNEYVKWILPYSWRVDILGHGFTKDYGAIIYSFILSDSKKFESLTKMIKDKNEHAINVIIDSIFSPKCQKWYSKEVQIESGNINQRYSKRYFPSSHHIPASRKVFEDIITSRLSATINSSTFVIDGVHYPKPKVRLFGVPNGKFLSCIIHGDMNSNNIFIAENDGIIFIDFQDTGIGHVFEDFIVMESNLRLHYYDDIFDIGNARDYLKREIFFNENEDCNDVSSIQSFLKKVRFLARENFPNENFNNYFYGLAAFNFRLLRLDNLSPVQKVKCVCTLIAALHMLPKIDEICP